MPIVTVTQITPASIQACQIGASFDDFTTIFPDLAAAAYQCTLQCMPPPSAGGAAQWSVNLVKANYPAQTGSVGDWIVFDGVNAQIVTNTQMAAQYTQAT